MLFPPESELSLNIPLAGTMPDLLIPGRKPVGPVAIDWTNPLAKDLYHCWLFQSGRLADNITGLGNPATRTLPFKEITGQQGTGIFMNTAGDYNSIDTDYDANLAGGSKYTFMGWFRQDTLDVDAGLFTSRGIGGTDYWSTETWNDGLMYFSNRVSNSFKEATFDYSTAVTAGEWFHLAFVFDGDLSNDDIIKFYINGERMSISVDATMHTTIGDTGNEDFEIGYYRDGDDFWNGSIASAFVYLRPLTAFEVKSLYENSYQFLKPAGPTLITNAKAANTGYHLPDVRLERPRSLLPRQLPAGPIAIDWDHALAKYLTRAYVFEGYRDTELVSGHRPDVNTCQLARHGLQQTSTQDCEYNIFGTGYSQDRFTNERFPNSNGIIIARYRNIDTPQANCRILGMRYSGWDFSRLTDTTWRFRLGADDQTITLPDIFDGQWWTLVWRWDENDGTGSRDVYAIDESGFQTKGSSNAAWSVGSTSDEIHFLNQDGGANGAEGILQYCYIFNLLPDMYSDEYRQMFHYDPYMFIVPDK